MQSNIRLFYVIYLIPLCFVTSIFCMGFFATPWVISCIFVAYPALGTIADAFSLQTTFKVLGGGMLISLSLVLAFLAREAVEPGVSSRRRSLEIVGEADQVALQEGEQAPALLRRKMQKQMKYFRRDNMQDHAFLVTPQQTLAAADWLSPLHHPYAASRVVKRGLFQGLSVTALVPPMGASPLSCIIEDLVVCGVEAIFLVCAAWSLGPPVGFGELIVPAFSVGPDGTSIHYGNQQGEVYAAPEVVDALAEACRTLDAHCHIGGNGTCEALYRITPEMAGDFRRRGCLCVDNGEASTVFAMAHTLNVVGGVLFQPSIELERGWDPARLAGERYRTACRLQAEAVLNASVRLGRRGRPGSG